MPAEEKTHRHRGRTLPDFILPDEDKQSSRRFLGGGETTTIVVQLKTVTPILGGGYRTRKLDDVDVIRVPTIRGHLRFWWRALYAQGFIDKDNGNKIDSKKLYKAECELWGGAGGEDDGAGKSQVELSVEIKRTGKTDESDVNLRDDSAYALWPARGEGYNKKTRKYQKDPAPRRGKTEFTLTVYCPKGGEEEQQVRNTLKAWILFGGYGSRTRRGLGSLTVTEVNKGKGKEKVKEDINKWLPKTATRDAINGLFEGLDPLGAEDKFKGDTPRLQGALLYVKDTMTEAQDAWEQALNKLKDFRQGTTGDQGERAREPDPNPRGNRASISNWPEADKIRRLSRGNNWSHQPRHNNNPVWPRAGFGLPIVGRFQKEGRRGEALTEPGPFTIMWKHGQKTHDRLASPLILKPLPLANGKHVPCALWLNRGYPKGGQVGLTKKENGKDIVRPESAADFKTLTAKDDDIRFDPLKKPDGYENEYTLRDAFLDWLKTKNFKEVQ